METRGDEIREGQRGTRSSAIAAPLPLPPLPSPLTSFIGREQITATIVARLDQHDVRLLTLTGPGGVGKTRLAIHVAGNLNAAHADGVGFIALAEVTDPQLVMPTIAARLDLQEGDRQTLVDRLATRLSHQQTLLVLDNFEQVSPAAPMLTELLVACPALTLLVTSRAPLHVSGEHIVPVPPLSLPHPGTDAEVVDSEAVRLFVERARAVDPAVTLSETSTPAIAKICARLDGLPLAIELAAARSNLLSAPAMLAGMAHRLPLLAGGPRDQPDRLQTMANAIGWSYDLLAPDEQALFRRLSVFAGGFNLPAAAEVGEVDPDAILDRLQPLIDHSLVTAMVDMGGEPRFTMLETIREFGHDQRETSGERDRAEAHHAHHFLVLAERDVPHLDGPDGITARARLDLDRSNLRAALAWFTAHNHAAEALRMAVALWPYWRIKGDLSEGRDALERALALAQPVAPMIRANALRCLGEFLCLLANYDAARDRLERSEALSIEAGNRLGEAGALDALGTVWLLQGDPQRAITCHARALAIRRELGARLAETESLTRLSIAAFHRLELGKARHLAEDAHTIAQELGVEREAAFLRLILGRVAFAEGAMDAAQRHVESALASFEKLGDQVAIVPALNVLGQIAIARGETERALSLLTASLRLRLTVGLYRDLGDALERLASITRGFDSMLTTQLLAAVATDREISGTTRLPWDQESWEHTMAQAQAALGTARFATAWQGGQSLSLVNAAHKATNTLSTRIDAHEPPTATSTPGTSAPDLPALSPRETEVLQLVAMGHTNRAIGEALFISPATAKRHVSNILAKLDVPTRAAAISLALRAGLVSEPSDAG